MDFALSKRNLEREMLMAWTGDRCFKTGVWGSIIAAICCFTPVLVVGLGLVGLATFTPYLDYVLLPSLGVFLILAAYGWSRSRTGV